MARITVNREERLSQVVAVRLTEYQARRLQNTVKNFGIKGSSSSAKLRLLLRKVHWISVRHASKHRELRRHVQLKRERIHEETEEEAPEELF